MSIYLQTFVTCFDTVEPSLSGVIQVSDHFPPLAFTVFTHALTRVLTLYFLASSSSHHLDTSGNG